METIVEKNKRNEGCIIYKSPPFWRIKSQMAYRVHSVLLLKDQRTAPGGLFYASAAEAGKNRLSEPSVSDASQG